MIFPAIRISDAEEEVVKALEGLVELLHLRPGVALGGPAQMLVLGSGVAGLAGRPVEAAHVEAAPGGVLLLVKLVRQGWKALA